jgi:Skp family chaperone for outer membrane proteins
MIIESKVEFQPSEINEVFDNILGIVAKVKLGMDMKSKISQAHHEKWGAEDALQKERDAHKARIKEMREDHEAEIKALKAEIEKLKGAKKEEKKNAAAK